MHRQLKNVRELQHHGRFWGTADIARTTQSPQPKQSFEPLRCRLLSLGADMRRRDFLGVLGGAAAVWPVVASAQQPAMPVIAVLGGVANGPEGQARVRAFSEGLHDLGRVDGRNVRLDIRLLGDNLGHIRADEVIE